MSYVNRESKAGPKKLLSIDGGGLRGMLSIQILARIEALFRAQRNDPNLVLAEEFDYIAGTSTGAIIAAGLALGKSVADIDKLYTDLGPKLFDKRMLVKRAWSLYKEGPLREALQDAFGKDTKFGDAKLQTLLLCVLHNASTDSPWPLSNCSTAKYNDRGLSDCNLEIPLWQVVRASTAAPIFFPPEEITLGGKKFVFQDGGVTSYNNPAFIQYLMATTPEYRLHWTPGVDDLLSVSIGTGSSPAARASLKPNKVNVANNVPHLINFLMNSASAEQDRLCRLFGDCRFGAHIDGEVEGLQSPQRAHPAGFSYIRYNADLSAKGLAANGFGQLDPGKVAKLDAVDSLDDLRAIGKAAANEVQLTHFRGFLGTPNPTATATA